MTTFTASGRRTSRGLLAVLVGLLVAAAAVLGTALPASAHDQLIESTPAEGAVLDAAPTEIVLTYSGAILDGTATVAVLDETGADHVAGVPSSLDGTVTVPVEEGLASGAYEIRWAVTSEDGHPISGVIAFSIDAAPTAEPTEEPSAEPTTEPTAEPSPAATSAPEQGMDGGLVAGIVIGSVLVVAAIVTAVIAAVRRGKGSARS